MTEPKPTNRFWGDLERPKSKAEFFNAVTAAPNALSQPKIATIRLYGPIDSWGGWWGISTKDVGRILDALPDSVEQIILRINSPGGEVSEGMAILNMLRAHKAKVLAVVDGRACSAASFLAAGCDEVVMSPGTLMMIHSPWNLAIGNAAQLRKVAAVLDVYEASMIEVYTAKAGEKNWAALLAEETWLTGAAAIELGLADRTAVIPDAGESSTAGEEPVLVPVVLPADDEDSDDDDIDDVAAPLIAAHVAASLKLPVSTEPGDPNRKENAVAYSDLQAGLRERLGVTDADASDEMLLAALDETLEEQADTPPAAALAESTMAVDRTVFEQLQRQAALGAEAHAQAQQARQDQILDRALAEGRITAASRPTWAAQLAKDEEGTSALLSALPTNTAVPMTELGVADGVTDADAALYAQAFGEPEGSI